VTERFRYRAAEQAIKTIDFIYRKRIVHSDLVARQFLLNNRLNLRLSDFDNSSLDSSAALIMENITHFLSRDEDSPNIV
jgi:serine/threonine protein kinase